MRSFRYRCLSGSRLGSGPFNPSRRVALLRSLLESRRARGDKRLIARPPYDQEKWVEVLDYKHRPIGTSLALIRAVQAHITQLLRHVPDSWDHSLVRKFTTEDEGHTSTLSDMITVQIEHTAAHLDEIRQTRKIHHR